MENPKSLPMRGAWIEIAYDKRSCVASVCRSPCGERGLKFLYLDIEDLCITSLPMRGVWIEISGILP